MVNCRTRVLLIEDDASESAFISELLRNAEFDIETAGNCEIAIEELRRRTHDVCLVDCRIGGSRGLDLLRGAVAEGCRTPIIMISGHEGCPADIEAVRAGASDCLLRSQLAAPLLRRSIKSAIERGRALNAVRESEERFRILTEQSLLGIYIVKDSKVVFTNEVVCEITGYTRREILSWESEGFIKIVYPDDRAFVLEQARKKQAGTGGVIPRYEFRIISKSGEVKWLSLHSKTIQYDGGNAIEAVVLDITEQKLAEAALNESEERYRTLVEHAADMICTIDLKSGAITNVNAFVTKILGYERGEILRKLSFLDLVHQGDQERVLVRLHELAIKGTRVPNFALRLRKADGDYIQAEVNGTVTFDSANHPATLVGVIRDVTERKKTEDALRESEARYRLLAENASDHIWTADMSMRFTYLSPSLTRFRGYTVEEGLAQTLDEVLTPQSFAAGMQALAEELEIEAGETKDLSRSRTIDLEHNCKDGSTVWAEVKMTFIRDAEGRPVGVLGVSRDISERKRAEQALMESETRYRTLVEEAREMIVTLDLATGTISNANKYAGEALGYKREDVLNKVNFREMIHPDDFEDVAIHLHKRVTGEEQHPNFPFRLRKADGSYMDIELNGAVIYDGEGRPKTYMGVMRDVTERNRAEQALRESEERYRVLVDNSLTGIYLRTGQNVIFVNNRLKQILGYSEEELLRMRLVDVIHPADRGFALQRAAQRMGGWDNQSHGHVRVITKSGEIRWVETFASLINFQGKPTVLGTIIDITDAKRAEELLRQSEEKYRNLLDTLEIGFYETDLAGNIIFFNETMSRLLGYSGEELRGMNYRQFIDEKDRDELYRIYNMVYETGHSAQGFVYNIVPKDGRRVPHEASVILVRDEREQPVGFRGVARDVTERKRAEELLRQSEGKYRTLFEESKDVVYITTPDGRFVDINPAGIELFGYSSKEEILRIDIAQDLYAHPDDRRTYQETIARQGYVKDYEILFKRKDGQPVTVMLTANALRDGTGAIVAYRGIMRDVTDRKQLEEQFFQAQKMESIGTLAGGIAHDFNNLLGGILGYASFMKTKIEESHPFYKYVDTIERSGMRAAELTSQLLAFARGGKYHSRPVDLNAIVAETLGIIGRTFDKSIEIETQLCSPLPTVEADAGQIQQLLMNLCVNARDAMSCGGKLFIETNVEMLTEDYVKTRMDAKTGPYVTVSITDTGVGIRKEHMKRIFEPFFTTKEKGKGTGLGLSMVYGVVKNHGGFVRVYSEPGIGTTFKVYLPASGKPEMKELLTAEAPRGGNELILVVDDEEPIRALTKDIFESYGYQVLLAEDGGEATEVYEKRKDEISLVILDMVMPRMGGRETFLKLKELNPTVKALLSTGYSQNGKAQEILNSGVLGFIQKPYHVNELLSKVRGVLDAKD
ncbi:PAS domain S-box protein [Candidatus Poribacteria bacterium]|nr:PAS domain S-box protein [Candidatus Poribacteria bacterium]